MTFIAIIVEERSAARLQYIEASMFASAPMGSRRRVAIACLIEYPPRNDVELLAVSADAAKKVVGRSTTKDDSCPLLPQACTYREAETKAGTKQWTTA
ncbi:hypothetical protein [Sinorhizobium arboris]|uniref:hypothetical protein n=1 Tax=Sinorhizobium arboris TaxID=76745 RepID=UPI00124312E9|nr:hypothetical protein [Sinorhizobium arboris]